jgi:hypothetical protein
MAVCSQIHTKHINTVCGQNESCCMLKAVCTQAKNWSEKDLSYSNIRKTKKSPKIFSCLTKVSRVKYPPTSCSSKLAEMLTTK